MDFASKPGLLFVVATLSPLASFVLILLAFAIRTALRSSPEGSFGEQLYQATGGDVPARWPAWLATGAIGLAFVCSVVGFVQFLDDHKQIDALKEERAEKEQDYKKARKTPNNEKPEDKKTRQAIAKKLAAELDANEVNVENLESHWTGNVDWLRLGAPGDTRQGLALQVGLKIDHLSAIMFLMVTLVATLIHLFSIGYMGEEQQKTVEDHQVHGEDGHYRRRGRFGRFFLFLSLFCFSMLNLILADNLFQVFVSWELVGICSYLLVGFYFERQSASNAANKAFITNRIGDAGFIIGLMIVFTYLGTFTFDEIFHRMRSPLTFDTKTRSTPMPMAGEIVRGELVAEKVEDDGRTR